MAAMHPKYYPVDLHILSPVHVGAGRELDPFSYVIVNGELCIIDLAAWMAAYPERDRLAREMDTVNFAAVRTFIARNVDPEQTALCRIPVHSGKLIQDYNRAIEESDPRNQVLVEAMTRNDISNRAYIPGSSIKGAIRTAIADSFAREAGLNKENKYSYDKKIFGSVTDDPMRHLKVSDASLTEQGTAIVEAREFPLNETKSLTPKGHKEAALSLCQSGEPVTCPLRISLAEFAMHGQKITPEFLIKTLNRFYIAKYIEEYEKFYSSARAEDIRPALSPLGLALLGLRPNEALIRIGHFSHVECVTLNGLREPKTPKGKPWGTTRTLAEGEFPFGWCKLEFPETVRAEQQEWTWPFSREELEEASAARKSAATQARQEAEQKETMERAIQERKRREEEKQERLASMSEEEKLIAAFQEDTITEEQVNLVYNQIDSYPEEQKKQFAGWIKSYWQKTGKWYKKNLSRKQWVKQREKIDKIEKIIGEL